MRNSYKLAHAGMVTVVAMCFGAAPAFAQSSSDSGSNSMQNPNNPTSQHGTSAASTDNATGLGAWASEQATSRDGRISRDAYMTEAGRRFDTLDASERNGVTRQQYLDDLLRQWDTLDRDHRGLTPAEVSRLTGKVDVDAAALPRTGSGAQAGDMGPSNSKAQ